ncbi:hypothetical protein CDFC105_70672 [Clostridioides difficile]|nr:hypothetical protein CDFC105_70672 [Clostridioides difficile]
MGGEKGGGGGGGGGRGVLDFFFFKQKTAYEIRLSLVGSEMCIRDRYRCMLSQLYSFKLCFTTKSKITIFENKNFYIKNVFVNGYNAKNKLCKIKISIS